MNLLKILTSGWLLKKVLDDFNYCQSETKCDLLNPFSMKSFIDSLSSATCLAHLISDMGSVVDSILSFLPDERSLISIRIEKHLV